ncbi:MAG: hypothetical protein K2K56_04390 [Lachnospiraceae bacterium]|nr:hypothetical protein [Lachnospiraceae bacterium]
MGSIALFFGKRGGNTPEPVQEKQTVAEKTDVGIIVEEKKDDAKMDTEILDQWTKELTRIGQGTDGSSAEGAEVGIAGKVFNGLAGINATGLYGIDTSSSYDSDGWEYYEASADGYDYESSSWRDTSNGVTTYSTSGQNGQDGASGTNGANGAAGSRGEAGTSIKGEKGDKGDKGDAGKDATGKDGSQGLQGEEGKAGASVFIIYADDTNGTNATNHPTETSKYIGTYTGVSMPTAYSQYAWSQYRSYILMPKKNSDGSTTLQIK